MSTQENLAILPFTGGSAREGETIAELFSFNEALNQVFSIIPRTTINRAIGVEQDFQMGTGMTDPDTIAALGKQLGANYVVAGNITKLGNRNLLIISILKIDELRQIAGDIQTYTRIEEIQDKLPSMARNIIAAVRFDPSQRDKLAVVPVEMGGNIDSSVADTLAQILSIHLIRSGKYRVYPRTVTLKQVQDEYETQSSGVTADEQIVNMGRGDNPSLVLSVAARRLGERNMFNASIINLETGVQVIGDSVNYTTMDDGIEAMETLSQKLTSVSEYLPLDGDSSWYQDTTARAEAAVAEKPKPAARRSGGGAFGYGVLNLAAGLGSFIQGDWGGGGLVILAGYGAAAGLIFWELSLEYEDDLAGIPGTVGIGVAGVTVLYGFIRPWVFQKNHQLAGIADRIHLAVVPGNRGEEAVQLSYTLRF
ncbi:MAG: penicillin-binding protein activator LpoB [Treponema sp.]|nr:penicillin-binding protein activator LpoB [Treponema sp.]